jgi:pimeloyl-ACP methyl ester carboxylesterase
MFKDILHDQLGTWPLSYIPYGGADYGEVARIAQVVGDGDDAVFYDAWTAAAERRMEEARAALAQGHPDSARDAFLRAACFYAKAFHPLFGEPVDARLLEGARKQRQAFESGLALGDALGGDPALPLHIPFEAQRLPAWLVPAQGASSERRPLIVFTNGYDGTITDLYFSSAVAASRRGYHSLIFDGPGQGSMLFEHGVRLRPDWEAVIAAVLDLVLDLPIVDPERVALSGLGLGGYLAPRAAAWEPRLAACIADPGQTAPADAFRAAVIALGASPEQARHLGELPQAILHRMEQMVNQDRKLHWRIVQRGYWVHGVDSLRAYLASLEGFTLQGCVGQIRCPTLVTRAQDDPIAAGAEGFFDALTCPKTLLRFSAVDGAGGHCEMGNRSLLNRRVLDWLDEVMQGGHGGATLPATPRVT